MWDRKTGCKQANYQFYAYNKACAGQLKEVASYRPNGFGIYDMRGNVEEMMADCSTRDLSDLPQDGSACQTQRCKAHAVRGGDYLDKADKMHIDFRYNFDRKTVSQTLGFRLAQSADMVGK